MSCEEFRDLLALYAGGETEPNELLAVEAHLAVCSACARELDLYREARASLGSLREGEAPSGTWTSLWMGLRAELFPGRRSWLRRSAGLGLRYAAVLLLGLGLGLVAYRLGRATPSGLSEPAQGPVALKGPSAVSPEESPVRPATMRVNSPGNPGPATEFRFFLPRAVLDERGYLPRVESFPTRGEKDF